MMSFGRFWRESIAHASRPEAHLREDKKCLAVRSYVDDSRKFLILSATSTTWVSNAK